MAEKRKVQPKKKAAGGAGSKKKVAKKSTKDSMRSIGTDAGGGGRKFTIQI